MAIQQFRHRGRLGALAIALSVLALLQGSHARAQDTPLASPAPETSSTPQSETLKDADSASPSPEPTSDSDVSVTSESEVVEESEGTSDATNTETPEIVEIDLDTLILIPDPRTAERLESLFRLRVSGINDRIQRRQADLQSQLADLSSDDDEIRQLQRELSNLRAERDSLAIEHLLLMRQVTEKLVFPASFRSPTPSNAS